MNQAAIVTGAGSGIGRQLAAQLHRAGYAVALLARTRRHLEQTAELLPGGAPCLILPTDVSDSTQVQLAVDQTRQELGRIDVLANVAGVAPLLPIKDVTASTWRRCVDTNLTAVVSATVAAWPVFASQGSGLIVNVSSMASVDPFPGLGIYAAAKAAVNMFTRCTAREGADIGVRAVAIAPGAVETPMLREHFTPDDIAPEKTLSADEVAALICACVTGSREFESGETILMPSPA